MKHSNFKRFLCLLLAIALALPGIPGVRAEETAIVVDDTVTTGDHYFTYTAATDPSGMTGWAADTKSSIHALGFPNESGNDVAQTQHWVWNTNYDEAKKHTYTFTFTGTGAEIVGVKNDAKNTFTLDGGAAETITITGAANTPVTLYSVKGLPSGVHTIEASLPEGGTGLQVCYAMVYGASDGGEDSGSVGSVATTIPHTQQTGDSNYFTFSPTGWSAEGNSSHIWSDDPGTDPSAIWYTVNFVGNAIDIYAGKNWPMGYVAYYIDGEFVGEYSLYQSYNSDSLYITTIEGLDEGEHEFKAVATGKTGAGGRALIDCAQVVVYHAPYKAESITMEETSITMGEGGTHQLRFTTKPSYAGLIDAAYHSSDEGVVTVSSTGLLTAQGAGSATVTVSSASSGISAAVTVTVTAAVPGLAGGIVDTDTQWTQDRYAEVKALKTRSAGLTAWRNDIATSALALASVSSALKNVTVTASDFVSGGNTISADCVTATFIRSTMAYNKGYIWGSYPYPDGTNRSESADILWTTEPSNIPYNAVQPVWVEIAVPADAKPGVYEGTLTVTAEGLEDGLTFTYTLTVLDACLPDATEFASTFDVELWQYPYTSAEYYGVDPFSQEHLDILRSSMEIYKSIGGHAITTTIQEEAWEGQTYSQNPIHYPSMIRWEKVGGVMTYDYTDFDAWVSFCKELGIGDKIVLYSIAPWHNSIKYWENGTLKSVSNNFNNSTVRNMWTHFLTDLIAHLEEKGWFEDAYIGIDERGFSAAAFDLIDSVKGSSGKALKTAGAMDSYASKFDLALRVTDLNVGDTAAAENPAKFAELLEARQAKGYRTTLYSCTGHQPGNFSLCNPVESYWVILNCGRMGTAGFLRWAYDAWVADPLNDTTHSNFEAGDCFLIFPDEKDAENPVSRRSVRLARIAEGVRDINKLMYIAENAPALAGQANGVYETLTNRLGRGCPDPADLGRETAAFKDALNALTEKFVAVQNGEKILNIQNVLPRYVMPEKYLSTIERAPGTDRQYLGQPDMIRTETGRLITAYPIGHGKGPLVMRISDDGGLNWTEKTDTPASWTGSQETPTLYTVSVNGKERLLLITACPDWGADNNGNRTGFNVSYSDDDGETWSEYEHFWSNFSDGSKNAVTVAMASLVQLKDENGNYIEKWMGVYHHSASFINYKTYLTFNADGSMNWTEPVPYLSDYRAIESGHQICEVGMFRSPDGKRIVALARSQSHMNLSTMFYSDDEGETWSEPVDLPGSLAGERHKAQYDPISGKLLITFREIQYDRNNNGKIESGDWYCGDWGLWVGTYDQLMNLEDGEYCVTIDEDFTQNTFSGDTGYAGFVVLPDGTFVMNSYGHWDESFSKSWTGGVTTDLCYIRQARFTLEQLEEVFFGDPCKDGHSIVTVPGVAPTFDAAGLTEGQRCELCGQVVVEQTTIPMLDYNEGTVPVSVLKATAGDWQRGYEATEGPAELVLDDDFSTIWHTDWYGTSRANHWIQFELTDTYTVDGLRLKPRATGGTNGIITKYEILVSDDGENFRSVASGDWAGDRTWKVAEFEPQTVRFVRLVAVDGMTDQSYVFASAAEIRLTGYQGSEKPHEHEWSEWTVTTPATCTEGGVETRTCACGESETRAVAALGHQWKGVACERCDAVRENPFTDVPNDSFCIDAVLWAVEHGITEGTSDTTFNPGGACQRAIVVTFLWRAAGSPEPTTTENPFTDVKENAFYYKAVLWAVEKGITTGTSETTFDPGALCNRATVVTFLYRALGEPEVNTTENPFTDVKADSWYGPAVLWAVENGVTEGVGNGLFAPGTNCNRAQVVTFLHRAMA